jgi:hypothetical protein
VESYPTRCSKPDGSLIICDDAFRFLRAIRTRLKRDLPPMGNRKLWLVGWVIVLSLSSGPFRVLSAHSQSNPAQISGSVFRRQFLTKLDSYGCVLPSRVSLAAENQGHSVGARGVEETHSKSQVASNDDLTWRPKDFREYIEKAGLDLLMNPNFLLLLTVAIVLFVYRDETGEVIRSLQSVKLGSVELVRGVIDEIRLEINDNQIHFVVDEKLENLEFFLDFPRQMETRPLHKLFVVVDLQPMLFRLYCWKLGWRLKKIGSAAPHTLTTRSRRGISPTQSRAFPPCIFV